MSQSLRTNKTFVESILLFETPIFWRNVRESSTTIAREIDDMLHRSVFIERSDIFSPDVVLLRFFLRLNSFRMITCCDHLDIEKALDSAIPHPQLDNLVKIAQIAHRLISVSAGAILLGGIIGSCRVILRSSFVYIESWARAVRKANDALTSTLSDATTGNIEEAEYCISCIKDKIGAMYSLLLLCPFISRYLCPKTVVSVMAEVVDTVPEKTRNLKSRFQSNESKSLALIKELNSARKHSLMASYIFFSFYFPDLQPALFAQTDLIFSSKIKETCNNLCARAMKNLGMSFSEWVCCLYHDQVAPSEEKCKLKGLRKNPGTTLDPVKLLSECTFRMPDHSAKGVYSYSLIIAEVLHIGIGHYALGEPLKITEGSEKSLLDVKQLIDVFPHWSEAVAAKVLSRYSNDIEKVIDEALANNLPPDLQDEIEKNSIGKSDALREGSSAFSSDTTKFSLFSDEVGLSADILDNAVEYDPFRIDQTSIFERIQCEKVYDDEPDEDYEPLLEGLTSMATETRASY